MTSPAKHGGEKAKLRQQRERHCGTQQYLVMLRPTEFGPKYEVKILPVRQLACEESGRDGYSVLVCQRIGQTPKMRRDDSHGWSGSVDWIASDIFGLGRIF